MGPMTYAGIGGGGGQGGDTRANEMRGGMWTAGDLCIANEGEPVAPDT